MAEVGSLRVQTNRLVSTEGCFCITSKDQLLAHMYEAWSRSAYVPWLRMYADATGSVGMQTSSRGLSTTQGCAMPFLCSQVAAKVDSE